MTAPICFTVTNDDGDEVEHRLPSRWEICCGCAGNGAHDHPAFANGISADEFADDPDFREQYMRGAYDVRCDECRGTGKVLVPDEDAMTAEQRALFELFTEQRDADARERRADAWTRRMENGGAL